jgi:hypothetical protein
MCTTRSKTRSSPSRRSNFCVKSAPNFGRLHQKARFAGFFCLCFVICVDGKAHNTSLLCAHIRLKIAAYIGGMAALNAAPTRRQRNGEPQNPIPKGLDMNSTKFVYAITVSAALLAAAAFAQDGQRPPRDGGGPRMAPPPEALAACKGKAAGDTATMTTPDGRSVTGVCQLVFRPDRPPQAPAK